MSGSFSKLGLSERNFEVPATCQALVKKLTDKSEDPKKVKEKLVAEVTKEVRYWESRWNEADVYSDHEWKGYSLRMRQELMVWARKYIDTSTIKLESLW